MTDMAPHDVAAHGRHRRCAGPDRPDTPVPSVFILEKIWALMATPEWRGLRGDVQEHVKEVVGDRKSEDMHAYICGLDKMVKANRELLKSMGWDRTSIRYEKYD